MMSSRSSSVMPTTREPLPVSSMSLLLFQAAQRLPDGGAADAQLFDQLQFRQYLAPRVYAAE